MISLEKYQARFPSLTFAEPHPSVLEVVLENPAALNAADASMHTDLAALWPMIDDDETVRVVLVRGGGKNFSAGGDFSLIEDMIDDDAVLLRVLKEARALVYNIVNCSKPVVSAIRGVAVGAGLAVALLADISIAAKDARILDGHVKLGVAAGDHAALIWPLLCGLAKAKYHLMTNTPISGEAAEKMGLVSLCVEDEEVYDTALRTAEQLSEGSPSALRFTKVALNNWLRLAGPTFDASLALEFLGFRLPDVKEGLSSLREKRPPDFKL